MVFTGATKAKVTAEELDVLERTQGIKFESNPINKKTFNIVFKSSRDADKAEEALREARIA